MQMPICTSKQMLSSVSAASAIVFVDRISNFEEFKFGRRTLFQQKQSPHKHRQSIGPNSVRVENGFLYVLQAKYVDLSLRRNEMRIRNNGLQLFSYYSICGRKKTASNQAVWVSG
jgi:hypothetical protein